MATINILAGKGFKKGKGTLIFGVLSLPPDKPGYNALEQIHLHRLSSVQIATEEKVKKLSGTVGWGAVGALALGPLGLLAGVLVGGNKKEVTFIAEFRDGRQILATADSKTFGKLQAAAFGNS